MRKLTEAAQAAKMIRKELKEVFPDTVFRVRSSNFSMGDSVSINFTDGPTSRQVDDLVSKYQYGHFDGMQDMYENSNSRDDIPQAKFVTATRNMSDSTRKTIFDYLNDTYNQFSDKPDFEQQQLVYAEFRKLDFYNLKPESIEAKKRAEKECENNNRTDQPKKKECKIRDITSNDEFIRSFFSKLDLDIEKEGKKAGKYMVKGETFDKYWFRIDPLKGPGYRVSIGQRHLDPGNVETMGVFFNKETIAPDFKEITSQIVRDRINFEETKKIMSL